TIAPYSNDMHVLFFFSSRRRHTRFSRDWSSDVCSSDLRTRVDLIERTVEYRCASKPDDDGEDVNDRRGPIRVRQRDLLAGRGRQIGRATSRERAKNSEDTT